MENNMHKFKQAEEYFLKSLESDKENVNSLCGLGMTYKEMNELDASLLYYDKARGIMKKIL